jgi:purine catabolism regulator
VVNTVLAVLLVPPGPADVVGVTRDVLVQAASRVGAEVRLGVGHAVDSAAGLVAVRPSLRQARAVLSLAQKGVRTSAEAALDLELTAHYDRSGLAALAQTGLRPLIAADLARRTELVHTLEVYLRHGCSPTRTSAALHLGRQSLYQRLDRIKQLLGHPIDDPDRHAGLLLAATAHRLSGL